MEGLEGLSDEQIQQLLALGEAPEKNQMLAAQLKQAMALKSQPLAQGTGYGGVYTAPTALGMLGSMAGKYAGGKQSDAIMGQMNDLMKSQTSGRSQYFKLLMDQLRQGGGGPQAGQMVGGPGKSTYFGGPDA